MSKKSICLLVVAMILATCGVQAQEQTGVNSGYMSFTAQTRAGSTLNHKTDAFGMLDVEASFGYHFNDRWSLHIPLTASTGLFHADNSFKMQGYLGLSTEYKAVKKDNWSIIIAPKVQSTLGDKWGAMSYDLGVNFEVKQGLLVGVGVRYLDTYKSAIPNKCCVYATMGFRINSPKRGSSSSK